MWPKSKTNQSTQYVICFLFVSHQLDNNSSDTVIFEIWPWNISNQLDIEIRITSCISETLKCAFFICYNEFKVLCEISKYPLKFHTKFWTHTPKKKPTHLTDFYFCVWFTVSLNTNANILSETDPMPVVTLIPLVLWGYICHRVFVSGRCIFVSGRCIWYPLPPITFCLHASSWYLLIAVGSPFSHLPPKCSEHPDIPWLLSSKLYWAQTIGTWFEAHGPFNWVVKF